MYTKNNRRRDAINILKLSQKADAGDATAYAELTALYVDLGKKVNRKMLRLKKAGLTDAYSYTQAAEHLKAERVNVRQNIVSLIDVEVLKERALYMSKWLTYKTSTPAGEMRRRQKIRQKLHDKWGIDFETQDSPVWDSFIQSRLFKEFSQFDSADAIREGFAMIEHGYEIDFDAITKAEWKKYKKGELDIRKLWRKGWTQIEL